MSFGNMNLWLGSIDAMNFLNRNPFHSNCISEAYRLYDDVDILLIVNADIYQAIKKTLIVLTIISGCNCSREAFARFYAHVFLDNKIQEFFFLDDGAEAHAKRLADWIIEKMDVNQKPWTDSGRSNQRQKSHFKAWNNVKRSKDRIGKHINMKGHIY